MNFETEFNVGDTVYILDIKDHVTERCPTCKKCQKSYPTYRAIRGVVDRVSVRYGYYRIGHKHNRRQRKTSRSESYQVFCARGYDSNIGDKIARVDEHEIFRTKAEALEEGKRLSKEFTRKM
jgi:hypothetical protein